MSTSLLFFAALLLIAVSFLSALAALKLETFSRARLRKLRESYKTLAMTLERDFPLKSNLRITADLLIILFFSLAVFCSLLWFVKINPFTGIISGVILLLFTIFIWELCLEKMSLAATARLLIGFITLCKALQWVLFPIVFPMALLLQKLQEKSSIEQELSQVTAEDEILSLVEAGEETPSSGLVSAGLELEEKRMLNGVINLDKTFVHEIMTPRVDIDVLPDSASIMEMKELITKTGHSRIPIYQESIDSISGVVYAKDLLDDETLSKAENALALSHSPMFIPESKNVSDLLDEFRQNRTHLAVVLDEYGGTAGIVTIEDILEEIVGEIHDEYDQEEIELSESERINKDGFIYDDGRMPVWEVNKLLDLDISEEQGYDTLAGYIMASQGKIPLTGEKITTEHLEVEILEADRRKLLKVKIKKKEEEQNTTHNV